MDPNLAPPAGQKLLNGAPQTTKTSFGFIALAVLKWVEGNNYPATKVDGRCESDTELIDNWQRRRTEKMTHSVVQNLLFPTGSY